MDTSKKYYESFMLGFQTYGRGRTLEQYCRDEVAELTVKLMEYQEAQALLHAENVDLKTLMEFWRGHHFGASSETMTDMMDKIVGPLPTGKMALAAVYLLNDREGFSAFLTCGVLEIENNAVERCFRSLAKGRENWLQCGSLEAAKHTAFMYSLVESCRMNGLDFGLYFETVLSRIQGGDTDMKSMLPNTITLPKEGEKTNAA